MNYEPCRNYDDGDTVIYTPRNVVSLTGFAWLWAKLTGKPTIYVVEGKPQVYRVGNASELPSGLRWTEIE